MERKTQIYVGGISAVLLLAFIGYFFSLFNGNQNNLSTYSSLILICACLSGILWSKQTTKNKIFNILIKIDCGLFAIWGIAMIAALFI